MLLVGRRLAEQEMYVTISKLIQSYRLEWNQPEPMGQEYFLTLRPDQPANFTFVPRDE